MPATLRPSELPTIVIATSSANRSRANVQSMQPNGANPVGTGRTATSTPMTAAIRAHGIMKAAAAAAIFASAYWRPEMGRLRQNRCVFSLRSAITRNMHTNTAGAAPALIRKIIAVYAPSGPVCAIANAIAATARAPIMVQRLA